MSDCTLRCTVFPYAPINVYRSSRTATESDEPRVYQRVVGRVNRDTAVDTACIDSNTTRPVSRPPTVVLLLQQTPEAELTLDTRRSRSRRRADFSLHTILTKGPADAGHVRVTTRESFSRASGSRSTPSATRGWRTTWSMRRVAGHVRRTRTRAPCRMNLDNLDDRTAAH